MTWMWKSAVLAGAALLAAVVVMRETGLSLPTAETEAHVAEHAGHDHGGRGHGAEEQTAKAVESSDHGSEDEGHEEHDEGSVKLTPEQIAAAGITTGVAGPGMLVKEIAVPGRITLNTEHQVRVVPKASGTVAAIEKRLGEAVRKGEVLARIESREMADAKGEYLEAWRLEELARNNFEREKKLWEKRVTSEQEYLGTSNAHETAKIKLEIAHQKLHTLGLEDNEISGLGQTKDDTPFRTYELRSPIDGQVIARDVVLGQVVGTDRDVFTVADLRTVWVELAIQPSDLPLAAVGQEVKVKGTEASATARIVILSPIIDAETRSAMAIAEIDNSGAWKLGDYVSAQLIASRSEVEVAVPHEAVQTVKGQPVVFVAEPDGFRMRAVTTGREDGTTVEILSGLDAGETIAITESFTIKAELGKAEAEHEH